VLLIVERPKDRGPVLDARREGPQGWFQGANSCTHFQRLRGKYFGKGYSVAGA
jgi:hypothetical protein